MKNNLYIGLNKASSILYSKLKSLTYRFLDKLIGKYLFEAISVHIKMYHEAQQNIQNEKPDLKDLLPPPTPKQIIYNLNSFIEKQNECFGHASDKKDNTKKFEDLSIDELTEFHECLSSINKSFFDDKDFSIEKVEQISLAEATSFQNELDTRGYIEVNDDTCKEDND